MQKERKKSWLPEFYFQGQLGEFRLAGAGRMRAEKASCSHRTRFWLCREGFILVDASFRGSAALREVYTRFFHFHSSNFLKSCLFIVAHGNSCCLNVCIVSTNYFCFKKETQNYFCFKKETQFP